MKDQFVTYEIAKRLEELGFNAGCMASFYVFGDNKARDGKYGKTEPELLLDSDIEARSEELRLHAYHAVNAPLWQQAIDWLREKHSIAVYSMPSEVVEMEDVWFVCTAKPLPVKYTGSYQNREAAITKALELIK